MLFQEGKWFYVSVGRDFVLYAISGRVFFYANLGRDFFGLFIFSTVFSGYPLTQMWKQII
jgi:hypothetical protein